MEPTRARPVPFCFQSFLPEPETSHLSLVLAVPWPALGQEVADGFPDQVLVDVLELEDLGEQVDGAHLLVLEIDDGVLKDGHLTPPA